MLLTGAEAATAVRIPEHWTPSTVGDIAQVTSGGTPNRNVREYWGGRIPWITTSKIDFGTVQEADEFISAEGLRNSAAKVFPKGTILMAMYGQGATRGKVAILGIDAATNQACAALLVNPDLANAEFVFYYLAFRYQDIRGLGHGGNQKNLNAGLIRDIPVPLPPLSEQRHIVDILATCDHGIALTSQLIAAKQKRKRGLMQQLLTGNRRFPDSTSRTWTKRRLGDLFVERRETHRGDLPLLSITSKEGVVTRESVERRDTSNEDKSLYLRICPGDIGYNTMRMWQGVSAVSGLEGIVSPAYTICVPCEDVDVHFMGYLFKFPPVIHLFKRYSQGLVDDTLSLKFDVFAEIEVVVPTIDEQRAIAQVMAVCDRELTLLDQKLALLKQQKQGLMQQLLTGKVRVPA